MAPSVNGILQDKRNQRENRRKLAGKLRSMLLRQKHRIMELQEECYRQKQIYRQPTLSEIMENEYMTRLTVDLPGSKKQDINVQVDLPQQQLLVTAKRSYVSIDGRSCVATRTKCRRYSFKNDVIDVTQIRASLHCGVLTITMPKKSNRIIATQVDATNEPIRIKRTDASNNVSEEASETK